MNVSISSFFLLKNQKNQDQKFVIDMIKENKPFFLLKLILIFAYPLLFKVKNVARH